MDINTTATTNPNPHYMTKSQPFYYGDKFEKWGNTPMTYALDIAIENHIAKTLQFPLDRIIYASNEYCFRERTRRNEGELNLPFFNYYRTGFEEADRPWRNYRVSKWGLLDSNNEFTSKLGGKIKAYPITVTYEGTAFFAQDKDCQYAMNRLLYEDFNETCLTPKLETNDGTILENMAIFDSELEYMPTYQESDWLEQNRIWTIGIDFAVQTFMIGDFDDNPANLHVAKEVLFNFFSAKKLDYDNYENSEQIEWLLKDYFVRGD